MANACFRPVALAAAAASLATPAVFAAELPQATPDSVGMSAPTGSVGSTV